MKKTILILAAVLAAVAVLLAVLIHKQDGTVTTRRAKFVFTERNEPWI